MEVEDYVRTKWGYICKIVNVNDFREPSMKYGVEASYLKDIMFIGDKDIIKSSSNIIDLIEVGDLVNYEQLNGGYVLNKRGNEIDTWAILPNSLKNEDIKSVITREQLIEMQYKIESEE